MWSTPPTTDAIPLVVTLGSCSTASDTRSSTSNFLVVWAYRSHASRVQMIQSPSYETAKTLNISRELSEQIQLLPKTIRVLSDDGFNNPKRVMESSLEDTVKTCFN
ncbi:hypothetical protein J6590_080903 [Homalodisca vitripennis]|nr:hypothetical protein J6590_080903 [Homalodisca vitripennis]